MNLADFGVQLEPRLRKWVQTKVHSYHSFTADQLVLEWIAYIEQLIAAGGKRVRPYLVYVMYTALASAPQENIWQLCMSLELFHLFALIHDDIIDKADTRRGIVTSQQFISKRLQENNGHGDLTHVGVAQAILLGDLVLAWSFELLEDAKVSARVKGVFQNMINEVVIGQMLDVELMTRSKVDINLIKQKMFLKTASYTFIHPLLLGANCANAGEATLQFCENFGRALGLAFQIQDDLFDLTSSTAVFGKKIFTDLKDCQHTYFTQYILDHGSEQEKEQLCALWGKELTEADRDQVMGLFTKSGALNFGMSQMAEFFQQAETLLLAQPDDVHYKEPFQRLVAYIRNRIA